MKRLCALFLLLVPWAASAQVEVMVSLGQEAYLPGESVEAAVRISNFSGRRLGFGKDPSWLRFNIEAIEGSVVNQLSEVPDSGGFSLETSTRGTIRYDLQPLFDLSRPGRYRLTATVSTPEKEEVTSPPVTIEVIRGSRLWEREVGVTGGDGNERRKYLLQQANHLREVRLYVRITDPSESYTYKVVSLGRMVSFARPQPVIDRHSRLHVLTQITADDYLYIVITPDGAVPVREIYAMIEKRPQIRMNDEGQVAVIGGERRRQPVSERVTPVPPPAPTKPDDSIQPKPR